MTGSNVHRQVSYATDEQDEVAMDDPVRVGLVGLVGRTPGARLVRLADATENVARGNAVRRGGMECSTRYQDLLRDPNVEAVIMASPTHLHVGYEHTFVHTFRDLPDGIAAGEGPAPTFEDGYRCRAVLDAVEQSVEGRGWVNPEVERTKGGESGEV